MNNNKKKSIKVLIRIIITVLCILLILFGLFRCGQSDGVETPVGDNKGNLEFNDDDGKVETGEEVTDKDSIRVADSDEDMDADDGAFVLPDDEDYFELGKPNGGSGSQSSIKPEADKQQGGDKDKPSDTKPDTGDGEGEDEKNTVPTEEIEEKESEETEKTSTQWGTLY